MADFINQGCPAQCSLDHTNPSNDDCHWICRLTEVRYIRCDECGWGDNGWIVAPSCWSSSIRINGTWYCNPTTHDFEECLECGGWTDEPETCDYCVCYICPECPESHARNCYDNPYDNYHNEGDSIPLKTHAGCGTTNIHIDETTAEFVCLCEAKKRLALGRRVKILETV